jgi:hypothetical protein
MLGMQGGGGHTGRNPRKVSRFAQVCPSCRSLLAGTGALCVTVRKGTVEMGQ